MRCGGGSKSNEVKTGGSGMEEEARIAPPPSKVVFNIVSRDLHSKAHLTVSM